MKTQSTYHIALAAVLIGFSSVFLKLALNAGVSAGAAIFFDCVISVAVLSPVFLSRNVLPALKQEWPTLALVGVLSSGIAGLLVTIGLSLTTATNMSFITALGPILTVLVASFALKEKLPKNFYLVLIAMTAGAFLLVSGSTLSAISIGDLLVLAAAFLYAVSNVISKKVIQKTSPGLATLARFFFGGLFLLAAVDWTEWTTLLAAPEYMIGSAVSGALGILFFFRLIEAEGASVAAAQNFITAVVTTILAAIVLSETLDSFQIIGIVLIASGLFALSKIQAE